MDKRFFLALFLSLVVIAIWQFVFPPVKRPPVASGMTANDSAAAAKPGALPEVAASSTRPAVVASSASPPSMRNVLAQASATTRTVITDAVTPKTIYKFSDIGAAPVSALLRDYRNRSDSSTNVDLATAKSPLLRYELVTETDTVDLSKVPFTLARSSELGNAIVLTYEAGSGALSVSLTYTIPKDTASSYMIGVAGEVRGAVGQTYLLVEMPSTLRSTEADTTADLRSLAYTLKPERDNARSVRFGSLDSGEKTLQAGPFSWIAVKNKYFVVGILSPTGGTQFSEVSLTGGPRTSKLATTASATVVDAVKNNTFAFEVYAGPQESQRLARMGRDFDHVNPYGWRILQGVVHPIASKVIEAVMWMHRRLNLSYGWVLVILGIAIRLALWPLNQSTMRASLRMQELQPKLAAAQKQYKDPVQQREAIMKVYQEAGVSPFAGLTGCLPALLPMPILFALFFVFQNTIEFRGVPFLWLHDISVRDPLYILPLLMGVSMYLLSWIGMRNAPANPQAKMMGYMFPVVMTVVLLNLASGLNLYYTAQNIAALPQQWFLARERAKIRPAG
jgi:YidC/Oxa1 family membrane protein insertase